MPDQHAEELLTLGVALGELLDDLESQHAREAAEFRAGYDLGFAAGREIGYAQAETDMERAWQPVAESVRRIGRSLTRDEIERRRWDGRREDFGKPRPGDYMGGPVAWTTERGSAA
ncbi:hypothetical protein ACGFJT_24465 [Actinomadura geliboluensis]|uniref:hypothetical protein n=1 Tax=Actinomadura geliboluensis TaxID=882440 RepID=UPI00371693BE